MDLIMRQATDDLRGLWVARAKDLDSKGYFAAYPPKRRQEILKKGFLGEWPPDRAIVIARQQVELGIEWRTAKFVNEMRDHFGLVATTFGMPCSTFSGRPRQSRTNRLANSKSRRDTCSFFTVDA
jgi:hypothetical protein